LEAGVVLQQNTAPVTLPMKQHPVPVRMQTAQDLAEELLPEEQDAGSNTPTLPRGRGHSTETTDMTAPPANLGDSKPAIILNLTTKEWIHPPGTEWIPWVERPRSFSRDRLQNMSVKGRKSRGDKDAEQRSDQILRSPSWVVSNETPFHILEQLVQMLCVSFFGFVSVCWSVRLCVLFLIAETA
jgi:hypothetical protein